MVCLFPVEVLIIGERDVHELLPMHYCIDVMQRTFAGVAASGFTQPARIIAWQPDRTGAIAAMPAWLGDPLALGAKLISVFPQNRQAGMESHQGLVALFETEHGALRAILHAGAITAIRTAAVSGLATRLLANRDAGDLAILGSGTQAHTHLQAMLEARPIRSVRVWSRTAENARAFAQQAAREYQLDVKAVDTARDAVEGAEIVCTVTASTSPILEGRWIADGAHVNAVGSSVPPFRELDTAAIVRSKLFVDSRDSALREPDDIRVPIAEGAIQEADLLADLAELASGKHPGRASESEITIFKSVGLAIEDLAAANAIYERALADGKGTALEF